MPLVLPGQEVSRNEPGRTFTRHHHLRAYAALLVSGTCQEAGDRGRFRAVAGDVLIHSGFDGHQDRIGRLGARIINFAIDGLPGKTFGHVTDLDAIVRACECDPAESAAMLREQFHPHAPSLADWPDLLAEELGRTDPMPLARWAEMCGLSPASLSRGFKLAYGVTPKRYRFEQRVSRAARSALRSREPLSMVAAEAGFADQAHMTRAMVALFGLTPLSLRRLS